MHIFRPSQKHLRIFKNKVLYELRTQGGGGYPPVRKYEKPNTFFEKVGVVLKQVDCGLHLPVRSCPNFECYYTPGTKYIGGI